jgi:hypothetical protein
MKPIVLIAALAAIATSPAWAQSGMIAGPSDGSTGPTVPSTDTRQIDQSIANVPSAATSPNAMPAPNAENWRSSSGLNADPNNPSGAPAPATGTGTSPQR